MAIKLEVAKDFAPCPTDDGDELFPNGIFEFNITKMARFIEEYPGAVLLKEVVVSSIPEFSYSYEKSNIEKADVSRPVILAEIAPGRYNLIDGNHRVERARRLGLEKLPAYWLNVEQHMKFLVSRTAYETYVDYWNSKLK